MQVDTNPRCRRVQASYIFQIYIYIGVLALVHWLCSQPCHFAKWKRCCQMDENFKWRRMESKVAYQSAHTESGCRIQFRHRTPSAVCIWASFPRPGKYRPSILVFANSNLPHESLCELHLACGGIIRSSTRLIVCASHENESHGHHLPNSRY